MVLTITNLSNRPAAQIKVLETGDLSMELVQTFGGIVDLLMNPSSTQVSSFKCFNCWPDGPLNQGVLLQPSGTGAALLGGDVRGQLVRQCPIWRDWIKRLSERCFCNCTKHKFRGLRSLQQ